MLVLQKIYEHFCSFRTFKRKKAGLYANKDRDYLSVGGGRKPAVFVVSVSWGKCSWLPIHAPSILSRNLMSDA